MTLNTDMKIAFFIYGPSHAGKTQFQTVLEEVIGHKNRINIPLQRLCKDQFGTEGAEFKILDMVGDMSNLTTDDVSTFKEFTGGDKWMRAEPKGGKKYQFRNVCKIWYNGNQPPQLKEDDEAFFNRWILIHFPNVFKMFDKGTIKNLGKKIAKNPEEIQGIIHEAIKGVTRLYKREYFRKELLMNVKHLWKYNSEPIYAFIYDYCIRDKKESLLCSEFKEKLNDYLIQKNLKPLSTYILNNLLEKYGIYQKRESSGYREYVYKGIRFKEGFEKYTEPKDVREFIKE